MNFPFPSARLGAFLISFMTSISIFAADQATPPLARKVAWQTSYHGETVHDDYRWLHQKQQPEVLAYLHAENAYADAMSASFKPLSDKLYGEIKARMKETDLSVPTRRGAFYYYSRTEAGKQYPIRCRRHASADMRYNPRAKEEILLDENKLAKGEEFFSIGDFSVSPNDQLLAYTTDVTGYRQYRLHIKNLKTGKLLDDAMARVTSLSWAADNQTLFVVQEDATTKRHDRLFRLRLGKKPVQVYHEADEQFYLEVGKTRDRQFIELSIDSTDTSEVRLLAASAPTGEFRSVLGREKGHRYHVEHRNGELFITTNKDAKNFRVVTAPLATPDPGHWHDLIAHDKDVLIEHIEIFRDFLVASEKTGAQNRSRIYDFASGKWQTLQFDEPVYLAYGGGTPEFTSSHYRLRYESPVTPPTVLEIDMASGAQTVLKRQEVLGGFDPAHYETRRLWAEVRDGVKVPMWAVYKKGIALDGKAPLLLYGYGSYGISLEAHFSNATLSLLDRGVIYVQAQIRGGTEMGEAWHDDGMLMKKKNTFYDFIDCAEYLVKQQWTAPNRLIIQGGSAGGLLMGAVVNLRPDLFHAVHSAVPFVDVINTMMDPNLPGTTGEYPEWGNPNEKPAYDYIRSYSPYDNLERKAYPSMLITTGLNDSQVMYWEPAKYVAKLRTLKTDNNPLLLKTNMGAGHGGASGRYDAIGEKAFQMAWMLAQWGISQ